LRQDAADKAGVPHGLGDDLRLHVRRNGDVQHLDGRVGHQFRGGFVDPRDAAGGRHRARLFHRLAGDGRHVEA
jgi:hypothetical protein